MSGGQWAMYVDKLKGGATQAQLAARAGLDQATICRWLGGSKPRFPDRVAALARTSKDTTVLAAFVAAGFLTEEEAKEGL